MKIPTEEYEKGVELCFNNVASLLEDANLLLDKGSYGHALLFAISAIEETSKAFMYSCGRVEIWKGKELDDVFKHMPKYWLFVSIILADSFTHGFNKAVQTKEYKITKPLKLDDLEELIRDFESTVSEIWKSRLHSLYVDYQQGKWLSPCDIEQEEVEDLLQYANKYKKIMEPLCSNIIGAPLDHAKQIQAYIDEQLLPSILTQLQKNVEWLFNNEFIDEKLYEKLLTLKK